MTESSPGAARDGQGREMTIGHGPTSGSTPPDTTALRSRQLVRRQLKDLIWGSGRGPHRQAGHTTASRPRHSRPSPRVERGRPHPTTPGASLQAFLKRRHCECTRSIVLKFVSRWWPAIAVSLSGCAATRRMRWAIPNGAYAPELGDKHKPASEITQYFALF